MSKDQDETEAREASVVLSKKVERGKGKSSAPRGRSATRCPQKRRRSSRSRTRCERPSRARSRSAGSASVDSAGNGQDRRRRESRRRQRSRGERSQREPSQREPSQRERSRRERSRPRQRKRKRRATVSVSSSCSSNGVDRRRKRSINKNRSNTQDANTGAFSLQDVMELLKSLPSSAPPPQSQSQSQYHFSMNTNAVPEFDPASKEQTIDLWIKKVEECSTLYQWSETQLIHYSLPKLGGVAKIWYQGLPSLNYTWPQWKEKLTKTFPTVENYAQLLHEMLDRNVRNNESLETYFYHKMNLLNRCDITGRRAVDCIIYGLQDRGMRLGAQAANYSEPEELLSYFKSIKFEDAKEKRTTFFRKPLDTHNDNNKSNNSIKCFNCNEIGHPSFKCQKPLLTCTICKRLGHQSSNCRRLVKTNSDVNKSSEIVKPVSEVKLAGSLDEKYVLPISVNGTPKTCYVDLGSQCTMVRFSDFTELGIDYCTSNLPSLKGFGDSVINPIGKCTVHLQVQSVAALVEVLIVPDSLLKYPVLLGHTFTEQAGIIIIKTDECLILQKRPELTHRQDNIKLKLVVDGDVCVNSMESVPVEIDGCTSCKVYVQESIRNIGTCKYYILPGLYTLTNGKGCVMILNLNSVAATFKKGQLLTRARLYDERDTLEVHKLEMTDRDTLFNSLKTDKDLGTEEKGKLQLLLQKYKSCFSFSLTDLGLTTLNEMIISLKDHTPVVYRPYRLAYSERNKVKQMIQEMLDCGIISESTSAYASPIILVQKKTGDQRLCVDYRALNAKTVKEHYPLPRIEDQVDQLGGYDYFITLDLASGYYQIPIAPSSQDKTAFVTPDGQYQFKRMPFGLANAPSVFQKTVNQMLRDVKNNEAYAFMDDIMMIYIYIYISLYAVKNTKTKSTVKVLNNYISLFGIPSRLISDRGTSFTSKGFKDFVTRLGIRHVLNAVATPRANGQVERYNRTILASLSARNHNHNENEWDKHLEEIQLGLNTTLNKALGKSPSEVLFGIRLKTKGDGIVMSLLDQEGTSQRALDDIREEVNVRIREEQKRNKYRFDRLRKVANKYKVGDLVRVERDINSNNGKSKKLLPKLQGPYRIIKVLDMDRYAVEDTPLTRKQNRKYEAIVSVDKIHPWLTYTYDFINSEDEESNNNSDYNGNGEVGAREDVDNILHEEVEESSDT